MKKCICNNCGYETDIEGFSKVFYCPACGSKNEIKSGLDDVHETIENVNVERYKIRLRNAYTGRDIKTILLYCEKIMDICPNNFFANFMFSYCHLRQSNNRYMLDFFVNGHLDDATKDEVEIVMKEITRTYNYYDQKVVLINRLIEAGFDVSSYNSYLEQKQKKQSTKKVNPDFNNTNANSTIVSSIFLALIFLSNLFNPNSFSGFINFFNLVSLVYLIVNYFVVKKNGFGKISIILSIFLTYGIYPVVKLIFSYFLSKKCKGKISCMDLFLERD